MLCISYNITQAQRVNNILLSDCPTPTTKTDTLGVAIYSDNGGQPYQRLSPVARQSNTGCQGSPTMQFNYPGGVPLPPGNYWIAIQGADPNSPGFLLNLTKQYPLSYSMGGISILLPATLPLTGFTGSIVGGPIYLVQWTCP